MKASLFLEQLEDLGVGFFTGVPDSLLKEFNDIVYQKYGIGDKHIIAPNEGSSTALAIGYYLATKKYGCVYLQNSGLGNITNPYTSLSSDKVYGVPTIFVVGFRGEPNTKDEPQHKLQGEITEDFLSCLRIDYIIIDNSTSLEDIEKEFSNFSNLLKSGKSVAIVVRKNTFESEVSISYNNTYKIEREYAIKKIVSLSKDDEIFVSTTGKISRELFESRVKLNESNNKDFLAVGGMGHASMIALAIALQKKERRVFCIDGDGAIIMHMGSMALIGNMKPKNMIHFLLNNEAHESVGGSPTIASTTDFQSISKACGYKNSILIMREDELNNLERFLTEEGPLFIEIRVSLRSREDLGRPTKSVKENKNSFMDFIQGNN